MKKNILALLLSLVMAVTFIPTFAFAANADQAIGNAKNITHNVGEDDDDYDYEDYYWEQIVVGKYDYDEDYEVDKLIYSDNPLAQEYIESYEGIEYDRASNTLSINNFEGACIEIYNMGDITIEVNGNNYFNSDGWPIVLNNERYMYNATATITGKGSLNLVSNNGFSVGIYSENYNLDLECEGGVNILAKAKGKNTNEYGIYYEASNWCTMTEEYYEDDVTININCPMTIETKYANSSAHKASAIEIRYPYNGDDYLAIPAININNKYKVAKLGKEAKAYTARNFKVKYKSSYYDDDDRTRYTDNWDEYYAVLGASGASAKYAKKKIATKKARDKKADWYYDKFTLNSKVATKVSIIPSTLAEMDVIADTSNKTFTGEIITPSYMEELVPNLTYGTDYAVTYENAENVGKAKIKLEGLGAYSGQTAERTFIIMPKNTAAATVTEGKKAFTIEWEPQLENMGPTKTSVGESTPVDGYVIKYSTKSNMSKAKKTTVKGAASASKTIKKLSANKTYYVTIQSYKSVDKKIYYSNPSDIMTVKTLK